MINVLLHNISCFDHVNGTSFETWIVYYNIVLADTAETKNKAATINYSYNNRLIIRIMELLKMF